jgi:hypothetical protein
MGAPEVSVVSSLISLKRQFLFLSRARISYEFVGAFLRSKTFVSETQLLGLLGNVFRMHRDRRTCVLTSKQVCPQSSVISVQQSLASAVCVEQKLATVLYSSRPYKNTSIFLPKYVNQYINTAN